jgi:hypothetical protein
VSRIGLGTAELAKSSAGKAEACAFGFLVNMLHSNESYLIGKSAEFFQNKHFKEGVSLIPLNTLKNLIHAFSSSAGLDQYAIFSVDLREWQFQKSYLANQIDEQLLPHFEKAQSTSVIEANQKALDYEILQKSRKLFEAILQNIDRFSMSDSFEVMNLYRCLTASSWGQNHCNVKPALLSKLECIFKKCATFLIQEWKEVTGNFFKVIPEKEFIRGAKDSGKPKFSKTCPKTKNYYRLTENMTAFCRAEILCFSEQGVTPLRRAQKIENLIYLAYSSYLRGSYMVSMALYIGMNHRSIERLTQTWKLLRKESVDQWSQLCKMLDNNENYRLLRTAMCAFKWEITPFLPPYARKFAGFLTTIENSECAIKLLKFENEIVEARILSLSAQDKMIFQNEKIKGIRDGLGASLINLKATRDRKRAMTRGMLSSEEATVKETNQIKEIEKKIEIMEIGDALDYQALIARYDENKSKISQNSIKIIQTYINIKSIKKELKNFQKKILTSPRGNKVQKLTHDILEWHTKRSDQEFEDECFKLSSLYENSPRKDETKTPESYKQ